MFDSEEPVDVACRSTRPTADAWTGSWRNGSFAACISRIVSIASIIASTSSCLVASRGEPAPAPAPAPVPTLVANAPAAAKPVAIELGQSRVEVTFAGVPEGQKPELLGWIERCARAVAGYYGEFPVRLASVHVRSTTGGGIHGGQALPTSPPSIVISVGEHTRAREFEQNWSLTHEMVHLAFPNVPPAHHWIEEGLATYVEPIARARSGWIDVESVWAEWLENMPLGLPSSTDAGLDGTDSWGRTYWGGALYCLLADVDIRQRTRNRFGLVDALRAIIAAGGQLSERWPLERALAIGDLATGTDVLVASYRATKDQPLSVSLDELWQKLGVRLDAGRVRFDDRAPLADVRRAIVNARP